MHHRISASVLAGCVLFALAACRPQASGAEGVGRRALAILHTADLHSHLFPERVTVSERDAGLGLGNAGEVALVGGMTRVATLVERQRALDRPVFVFDAGDLFEGTPAFQAFGGEPELLALDALGVDAEALGNHDLALGEERLRALRSRLVRFPLLAANLESELGSGLTVPAVVVERQGIRVGVIGVGRLPEGTPNIDDAARAAQLAIDRLRPDADVIVLLSHLGSDLDGGLVARTTGADLVLGGHTHDTLFPPRASLDCAAASIRERGCHSRRVPVLHSGAYGRYVGVVDLVVSDDPADSLNVDSPVGRSTVVDIRMALLPVNEAVEEEPAMTGRLAPYRRALSAAGFDRTVAFAPARLEKSGPGGADSALGNLVADALRAEGRADVAFVNSTGIRTDLEAGDVTVDALFRVLPFDDDLVVQRMSGATLLDAVDAMGRASCARNRTSQVQLSGALLFLRCDAASELVLQGQNVSPSRLYSVSTLSFLSTPGAWLDSARAESSVATPGAARAALLDYVEVLPSCGKSDERPDMPCISAAAGARVDGRIRWK